MAERTFLDPRRLAQVKDLNKIAKSLGTSMAKLAIAWCLKNENVSTVILGASKPHHLEETLTSFDILEKMTPEVLEKIELVLGNKPA